MQKAVPNEHAQDLEIVEQQLRPLTQEVIEVKVQKEPHISFEGGQQGENDKDGDTKA